MFRGLTIGATKQLSKKFQCQANYQLSTDYSDDDQERDPFNFYYRVANNFKPEYNYSPRDERHRFNALMYYSRPWGIEFSSLFSAHSSQPTSINGGNTSVLLPHVTVVL